MDQLLALCSNTLIGRLAGSTGGSFLFDRLRAARAIRACIDELATPYREALTYRLGIAGELLSDEEIAARLHVALDAVGPLVDEAIDRLGCALICGGTSTSAEVRGAQVAA